jgi:hypothetical protein
MTRFLIAILAVFLATGPTALAQTTPTATDTPAAPTGTTAPATTSTPTVGPTATPGAGLSLSPSSAPAGAAIVINGSGFQPGETVNVMFNGGSIGTPTANTSGQFSQPFTVPNLAPGQFGLTATGQSSGRTTSTTFTITQPGPGLTLSPTQGAAGSELTVSASGYRPGETVQVTFNGTSVGQDTADTNGAVSVKVTVPSLGPGQYTVVATGQTSGASNSATFTIIAVTPSATAVPATTPVPTASPVAQTAPALTHDQRYFAQTGFRIDDDQIYSFFQTYGGIDTFGYPASRTFTFLGCPVQFFQRQIIQVCPTQGPALINMLDPDIFPYTKVNQSTFPAPDEAMKTNTPPVSDPNYAADITTFIQQNVPDTALGQPVNFQQTFNNLGGLTIWGAPISTPQADPSNANFIYQRFQRGIMHYIAGTGTESILLADYLKMIIMNQNVPADLLEQSRGSRFYNQYCPSSTTTGWVCRPNDLTGTDLTFAFEKG